MIETEEHVGSASLAIARTARDGINYVTLVAEPFKRLSGTF